MDPYVHTVIATGMLFITFHIGKRFGRKEAGQEIWFGLLDVFNAKKIEINEEGEFLVTDHNDRERKVN